MKTNASKMTLALCLIVIGVTAAVYPVLAIIPGVNRVLWMLDPMVWIPSPAVLLTYATAVAAAIWLSRFLPKKTPFINRVAHRVPAVLDLLFSKSSNPWLSGKRLQAAQQSWPGHRYPTLYKDIPSDVRRPVIWDGRLLGGGNVSHLSWRHLTDSVFVQAAIESGRLARRTAIVAFLAVLAVVIYMAVSWQPFSREYPRWAEEVGAWHYVAGHYILLTLEILFNAAGTLAAAALASAAIFVASWYFAFWRVLQGWWNEASAPLRTPTRDALLFWKARADIREAEYRAYCRQVDQACGRLADAPVIPVGIAEGLLRARGDMESPSPGQLVAFDGESIRQHTLVLGGTGSGKTRVVIRPLFDRIMKANWGKGHAIGAYVTDGKGTLWKDLKGLVEERDDVRVIGAEKGQFGVDLLAGMSPIEVATVFKSVSGQVAARKGDDFWPEQASLLLMHVAAIAKVLQDDKGSKGIWDQFGMRPYSLLGLVKLAADGEIQKASCEIVLAKAKDARVRNKIVGMPEDAIGTVLREAEASARWIKSTWVPMAVQTKSGILANLNSVLGKLTHSGALADRFFTGMCEDAIDVDYALNGHVVMVAVGETEFGMAGRVVNCWLKSRLFIAARRRLVTEPEECKKTSCALIADEWQMLVTAGPDSDTSFWNIARETGVFLVAATQSIAALTQALGEEQTSNVINLLRSKIVLKTEEVSTIDYIRKIAGEVPRGWETANGFYATQGAREIAHPDTAPGAPRSAWWHGIAPVLPKLQGDGMNAIVAYDASHTMTGEQAASTQISEAVRSEDKSEAALISGLQYRPKIESDELLLGAGHAFAIIQRAGGDRSDLIDLEALAA